MPDGLDPADLYQEGRGPELVKAVETARPLLEHRIESEVSRHDLSGPEGRARALHASVGQLRRVGDPIARREYTRFVARLIGVELSAVEAAMGPDPRSRGAENASSERPLDRAEAELLRVVLGNPAGMEISVTDFADERVREAFQAVEPQLAAAPPGLPLDPSLVEDPELQTMIRGLAMDARPLPDWADMRHMVRLRRLDAEIDALEAKLDLEEQGSETHSVYLRRLIALQQEKRSSAQ
jgi:DNA primase